MFRTLLVDDEPVFLAVTKIFLEKDPDISCETCESAKEALDLIRTGTFDAVVSDYDMPGMDGIALLKAVRTLDPDLPFILLTGRGREEVVIEALNYGADFYLQKSAEPRALYAELASKIRHAVDRRRAREALKQTQFSIDHLPAEFYWIDPEGYLIDVNDYACRKLGYTRNELFAMRVPDVDPEYDIERSKEAWQEAWQSLKEHQTLRIQSHHRNRDGTVYPVELSLSYCQMGEKEFMCAFATDTTERTQSERKLQESREQYRQLVEHSPSGIVIHDGNTTLFCNRVAAEIFGAQHEKEILGRPVLTFVDPEYHSRVARRIERIVDESGRHFVPRIEEKFIRLDGSVIDVEVAGGPVTFEGKPAAQVVFHDISERKQKERERLALKEQLETEIRDLNHLHALSTRYLEEGDFDALLEEILGAAIIFTGADKGNLQLLDSDTGMLKIVAQKNFKPPFLEYFEYVDAGDATACGAALERLERVVVEDICTSPFFDEETAEVLREEGLRAVQSTPLVSRKGHLVGILSTHFCRVHAPADRELRLIDILARQVADMIERKRAEERLRESEEKYRTIVETANEGIWEQDNRHITRWVNPTMASMLGYAVEEMVGRPVPDFLFEEDLGEHAERQEQRQEGLCGKYECRLKHRDGTTRWMLVSATPKSDEEGKGTGSSAMFTDITERKRAEEALQESEEKYRGLFESSLDGILIADMEGRFIEANQSALSMLGYTAEELAALTFWQITPACWHRTEKAMVEDVLARGSSDIYEKEYVRKDGTVVPINIRVWLKKDDAGRPTGMWAIVRDITEQKRAEQDLIESEQRLNLAVESAHLGVWDKDLATGEVITQGYWPGILGYNDYDDVPPWEEAVHPDDRERVANDLYAHMEGATPFVNVKYRMKRKNGRYCWIQSRGKVVGKDAEGRSIRMIGVDHDITPLRVSEESLKEANRKLNLLSSITRHDILNQVSAQKAFLALLEEHIHQEAEAQDLFQRLLATSNTIRRQITFTGDYQNMGERAPEWLHVAWVVKRAAESVRLDGTRLEVATPMPEIFADPLLEKAFFNLLENATVHGNNPLTIRVSFHSRYGDGIIVLEDDGVGVPAAQKEDIFERGIGKNTGLGLFLTREILEITGISIRECGREGSGARFEITIPKGRWRAEQAGE